MVRFITAAAASSVVNGSRMRAAVISSSGKSLDGRPSKILPIKLHQARPFQPFSIRLGDGQSLRVEHPEMLAYAPRQRTAVVYRRDGSFEIVDLLLVTGLDVRPSRSSRARSRGTG